MASEQVTLSSHEAELQQYRSVSRLAIIALCGGLASALALVHPVLWSVPPLAVAVAVLAVRHLARNQSALTGRWMAILGLVLALLFGSASASKYLAARWLLRTQAHQVAVGWLKLIMAGEEEEAVEWTLDPFRRRPVGVNLREFYGNDNDARSTKENFFQQKLVQALRVAPESSTPELTGVVEQGSSGGEASIILQYRVAGQDATPLEFWIHLQRQQVPVGDEVVWRVLSLQEPK